MGTVYINDQEVLLEEGERLNGIQAAQKVGVDIPHYCWHPGLSVVASCRMCLVETGRKDPETGKVSMAPKLVPACQTPAADGAVFVTDSEKVRQARAMVEEDLLIRHPVDCPICDKAGECYLQDYHFEYGQSERRADIKPFSSRRRPMGDTVTLFVDRCVMCSRCVRFTREVTGTAELMVINRGAHEEIDVFPGYPLANKMSGNVVDLCPVGALGDVDFLYRQRVWFMKRHDNVCAGCSTGCSIHIEENQDHVYRLKPRENMHVNKWWMCDDGRYGYQHVHDGERVTQLTRRDADGESSPLEWNDFMSEVDSRLRSSHSPAVLLSPHLTVEGAYLLGSYVKSLHPNAVLALGHVPVEGEDISYPGGFTIHAEKCPNRRGVEEVLKGLDGSLIDYDALLPRIENGDFDAVWVSGGYTQPWIDEPTAAKFARAELLVVQDLFASPLMKLATYRLPATAFAEREGSYVNYADRLQSFSFAIRPPSGLMTEGYLYSRLSGRPGMFRARPVMEELAREISYFAAAIEPVPPTGVDLRINMLAAGS